ncbi:MAG: AbrB/MazE/SpoVT family DNA-binding domain-containing protein [Methylococcaceae bacterium]|nr:AbrB/MazE/SpoVT family DNA-binding domain-containing protein [Methylococcaceae bacterium]
MQTTHISHKGQVIIPKSVRDACHLDIGQELEIEITAQGILLKAKKNAPKTTIDKVAGCLAYQGTAKTLEEMDDAIRQGVMAEWGIK